MIGTTRQFLRFFMVAVALCASSLSGYSAVLEAFETHTHGLMGAHVHHANDGVSVTAADHAGHDHADQTADSCEGVSCEEPAKSASHCAYMHTHCCASLAVPAGDCGFKLGFVPGSIQPERASHLPLGQLATPLFRPPRASA